MRTARFYQPIVSGAVLIEHQIFSQIFTWKVLRSFILGNRRYRMPITAKQLSHRRFQVHSSQLLRFVSRFSMVFLAFPKFVQAVKRSSRSKSIPDYPQTS